MKVSEIMETDLRKISIDKDRLIIDAIEMMKKQNNSLLLTLNKDKLTGILTERDLADRLGSKKSGRLKTSSLRVSSAQNDIPQAISPDTEIEKAAEIMIRMNVSGLPIMENNELVGLIDETIMTSLCLRFKNSSLDQIMTTNVISVSPDDRLIHARNILFEKQISFLPVCEGITLVGYLSEGMIARAFAKFRDTVKKKHQEERLRYTLVENFMKVLTPDDGLTLTPENSIAEAAQIMLDRGIRGVSIVKSEKMDLIGIITKSDMLKVQIVKNNLSVKK